MKAVILSNSGKILGLLKDEEKGQVEVAGAIAIDGAPVNRKSYRVSSSKVNLAKGSNSDAGYASRHEHNGLVFYTL